MTIAQRAPSTQKVPFGKRRSSDPFVAHEFFALGLEESASPFLTPFARKISRNLPLKASIFAAFLLLASFLCSVQQWYPCSFVLLAAVYLIVGAPALIHSVQDLVIAKDVNIDVLMTLAAFSAIFIGSGLEGALLLVLFSLSGAIEDSVSLKAKSAIMTLHSLVPTKACVIDHGEIIERAVQDVSIGSLILVRAGEIVPLDGVVVEGVSSVTLAHLTGESLPVRRRPGDEVASGAQVTEAALTVRVTHTSQDSTVSRIVQLVTHAQSAKPKLERWFDRFARGYSLTIILLAVLFAFSLAPLLGIGYFGVEGSIYRALAFLITASPCALILAVPIAYLSALGACAKRGIILKGGVVLDALQACSIVAFDKTGTLTLGMLVVEGIYGDSSYSEKELFAIAAALERHAVHPIAKAIVQKAQDEGAELLQAREVKVIPGVGVQGIIDGRHVFIGDIDHAKGLVKESAALEAEVAKFQKQGKIVSAYVIDNEWFVFVLADQQRAGVAQMLASLKRSGHRIIMLTGDHQESAATIARQVGISEFESELKPEDKLLRIEELAKSAGLAMCGDGVNDAPALARATVGIAMGQISSATARAVADVILLHDNIELLDWLFERASYTRRIVKQNLLIASVAIVFGSIPAICGMMPLWLAVIVHEGGTVLVGLNALRLLKSRTAS